ncbi:MAG: Gx transporter family protein [Lachnospiraceae bacterium]
MKNKVAFLGILTALALIFSYIESVIPFQIGIPGVKLGLANLIVVIALYMLDAKSACVVSVVRVVLAGLMFGSLFSILYSLAGGLLSFLVMYLLKRTNRFSILGVSLAGGVMHNAGQLLIAMVTVESLNLLYYLPILLVAGTITGLLIGVAAREIMRSLKPILAGRAHSS